MADLEQSDRCRALARGIRVLENRGLQKVFRPICVAMGPTDFGRLFEPGKTWPDEAVVQLAEIVAKLRGYLPEQVLAHLVNNSESSNPELVELMRGQLFRDNSRNMMKIQGVLAKYEYTPGSEMAWGRIFATRNLPGGMGPVQVRAEQASLGFGDDVYEAKTFFIKERTKSFPHTYDAGQMTTIYGFSIERFNEAATGTGYYGAAQPLDRLEMLHHFKDVLVKGLKHDLRWIKDGRDLPEELAQWTANLDGAFAVRDQFMMLIAGGGKHRTFLERTGDRQRDSLLDTNLARLSELLKQTDHTPDRPTILKRLDTCINAVTDAEKKRVFDDDIERMIKTNPDKDGYKRSPSRLHLPRH
jgi:hypothetical protein